MFLRPSLLPSSSSFAFEIGQRKPDTPRPTSKSFCLNPSRLSLNASTSTRKLVIILNNEFSKLFINFCMTYKEEYECQ